MILIYDYDDDYDDSCTRYCCTDSSRGTFLLEKLSPSESIFSKEKLFLSRGTFPLEKLPPSESIFSKERLYFE